MICVMLHQQPEVGVQQITFYQNQEQACGALNAAYEEAREKIDFSDPFFEEYLFHECPPGRYGNTECRPNCLYSAQLIYLDDVLEWYVYGDMEGDAFNAQESESG